MALQNLRSNTANKRPTGSAMSDGQIAVNTNATSPGLFFKDAAGTITKVGPVHVGSSAPNSTPATGGETGNSVGEQWLDTTGGNYDLKVWDGSAWRSLAGEFVNAHGDTVTGTLNFEINSSTNAILVKNVSGTQNVIQISKDASDSGNIYLDDSSGTNNIRFFGATGDGYFAGDVGIGTNNPSTNLHISDANPEIRLQDADGTNQFSRFRQMGAGTYYDARNNTGGGSHIFRTYNGSSYTERLRIASDGAATFDGSVTTDQQVYAQLFSANTTAGGFAVYQGKLNGTVNSEILADGSATFASGVTADFLTTNTAYITNAVISNDATIAGELGIGTTSPSYPVDIRTTTGTDATLQLRNLGTGASDDTVIRQKIDGESARNFIFFGDAVVSDAGRITYAHSTDSLSFDTDGTTRLTISSTGDVDITGEVDCAGLDVDGTYVSNVEAVSALDIDCSTGNYFTKSISSTQTFTFSNVPSSRAYSFTLQVTCTGTNTAINWPNSVYWNNDAGQTAPEITDARTHLFMFATSNGGTTFRGAALVDYSN
jgi:hypothetical protein